MFSWKRQRTIAIRVFLGKDQTHHPAVPKIAAEEIPPPPSPIEEEVKDVTTTEPVEEPKTAEAFEKKNQ